MSRKMDIKGCNNDYIVLNIFYYFYLTSCMFYRRVQTMFILFYRLWVFLLALSPFALAISPAYSQAIGAIEPYTEVLDSYTENVGRSYLSTDPRLTGRLIRNYSSRGSITRFAISPTFDSSIHNPYMNNFTSRDLTGFEVYGSIGLSDLLDSIAESVIGPKGSSTRSEPSNRERRRANPPTKIPDSRPSRSPKRPVWEDDSNIVDDIADSIINLPETISSAPPRRVPRGDNTLDRIGDWVYGVPSKRDRQRRGDRRRAPRDYGVVGDVISFLGEGDLWFRNMYTNLNNSESGIDNTSYFVNVGYDTAVSRNLVVGVLFQADISTEDSSFVNAGTTVTSKIDGIGWLFGPYVTGRVSGTRLFYDARIAYGSSNNDLSLDGTVSESYDEEKLFVKASLTGQGSELFRDWYINPHMDYSYYSSSFDGFDFTIPSATTATQAPGREFTVNRLSFGPTIFKNYRTKDGSKITPALGIAGLFDHNKNADSGANAVRSDLTREFLGKVDFGINFAGSSGINFGFGGYYEGLGSEELDNYGVTGGLRFGF